MAKITDPDQLNQGVEVYFRTGSFPSLFMELSQSGNLSTDGVTLQALYSFCKEEWKNDNNLVRYNFPLISITEQKFDLVNGWNFYNTSSKYLIRDAGWSLRDNSNVSKQEYMGVITLGTIGALDTVYYQQTGSDILLAGASASNMILSGAANQSVQIFESGAYDYRNYFKIFVREQAKTYDQSDLSAIGQTAVTYQVYSFPLGNSTDTNIEATDNTITGSQPYLSMSISYYTASFSRSIGGTFYHFNKLIQGNNGRTNEIYEFVQYKLRQNSNINSTSGTLGYGQVIGKTADELLNFVGSTLRTETGVYIDGFNSLDTNDIQFFDTGGIQRTFPFVAAGTITFNSNLTNDSASVYKMFFTSIPSGAFGSSSAVIVNNNNGAPITGSINGTGSITFTFDYDNNSQGGRATASDANVTIVAIGLNTAQYVTTAGTIARSNANAFSVVSSLERNYSNI